MRRETATPVPLLKVARFRSSALVDDEKLLRLTQKNSFGPFVVVDGAGWAPPLGSRVKMVFDDDAFTIGTTTVPFSDVLDLNVEGKSLTTGGGFIGGGFGARGAVEGMAAAQLLNRMTTKQHNFVVFSILGKTGRVVAQIENVDAFRVRSVLRPILDKALLSNGVETETELPSSDTNDISLQLERLSGLYKDGVLSDEEFEAAKKKVLGL